MANRRRKSKKSSGVSAIEKAVIIAVVVILLIFLISKSRELQHKNREYVHKIENLEIEIQKEEERAEELVELESDVKTPEYAEKYAKDHWGLVGEDEIIFRPEN